MTIEHKNRSVMGKEKSNALLVVMYGAILLGCIGMIVFLFTRSPAEIRQPGPPESPSVILKTDSLERFEFFDQSVQPKIAAAETANREAVARCLKRIDDLFGKYQTGVQPFTKDIMSFGSRWQTVKNMSWDWWHKQESSAAFVGGKIEEHLFSEESLTKDLDEIMQTFREDVQANQARLLTEIRASISTSSVPELVLPDNKRFSEQVADSLNQSISESADSSVQNGIVTLIVSEVGAIAAQQLIAQLLTKIGTAAATTGAAGGTAMAGGAAAGGGTGAFGGPVGAAIGVGVGLVAGIVIDYFMSKSFESKLTNQMTDYLHSLKTGLVNGGDKSHGLADDLNDVCDSLTKSYRSSLFDSVVSPGGGR